MYDQTKLRAAVRAWLAANCLRGRGETYAKELQVDFCTYSQALGLMKGDPGRVAFGKELRRHGLHTRKSIGLTYYVGITLKTPFKQTLAQRVTARRDRSIQDQNRRAEGEHQPPEPETNKSREERLRQFQQEIDSETADRARAAGEDPLSF